MNIIYPVLLATILSLVTHVLADDVEIRVDGRKSRQIFEGLLPGHPSLGICAFVVGNLNSCLFANSAFFLLDFWSFAV
jgi:hypothetical protein